MSTTVKYKGETLTTVSNTTKTLETKGTWLEDDIELTDVSGGGSTLGTKSITNNGTYNASSDNLDGYSQVTVSVPASAVDSGTKSITANGNNQDVVGYAAVNVNVPNSYSAGDEGKVVSSGALVAQTAHADVTPTTSDQTIDTTTNNSIKVKGDANLVAGNIKKDVVIFNTTGTYEGGGGGSGLTTVASGTFTAAGEAGSASAGTLFFVGKKMPQTSFWFKFKAQADTEFAYDGNYKWAYGAAVVFPDFGYFDLSSVGDSKQLVSDISYDINNSGTVTSTAAGAPIYNLDFVRNATAKNPTIANNLRIDRRSDGFYVRPYHSNTAYLYPSGVKYDWEVVYFGTNSATDIVEIP